MEFIGREEEIKTLTDCYQSNKSEFVAVYGRRRVGKTFLIKELLEDKFTFYGTGILNGNMNEQLQMWNREISRFGGGTLKQANNWIDAFENLNALVEQQRKNGERKKKVIFLDEVPWMSTRNSDFLTGLDYFWNRWASSSKDVLLIICGSAASWMLNKIVNHRGGLHNRLTRQLLINPFTLKECQLFYESRNIPMTRYQMTEAYMIFGGIPYYMSLMEPHLSLYQNVDKIYFAEGAPLKNEFSNLYQSLYENADSYIRVIETLAKKGIGLSRNEIAEGSQISNGGTLTKILKDLSISGFIRKYNSYGQKKRDSLYQLIDLFSLFDIRFRDRHVEFSRDYWLHFSTTSTYSVWSGFSFEKVALLHLQQIRKKLGISGVLTSSYSWRGNHEDKGTQIDLVIERNDNLINLCEMKFASGPYTIDKKQYQALQNKKSAFIYSTKTRKAVQITMITTFGLRQNSYSAELVSQVILDDLFE